MIGFGMRDKCKIVVNKDAEISKGNMFKVLDFKQILVGEIDAFSQNICKHDTHNTTSPKPTSIAMCHSNQLL